MKLWFLLPSSWLGDRSVPDTCAEKSRIDGETCDFIFLEYHGWQEVTE